MATPEETRNRIKEMRERIFKEGYKDSFENDIKKSTAQPLNPKKGEISKEDELSIEKAKIVQKNGTSAGTKNPVEAVDKSFSDKFQQSDDLTSELSTKIQEKTTKFTLDLENKHRNFETKLFNRIEQNEEENNSKIFAMENLLSSIIQSTKQEKERVRTGL